MSKLNIKSPYYGFENYSPKPYTREEGRYFFGRNRDLQIVKDLLRQKHFVALVSSFRAGKTSFLQAGLTYDLQENGLLGQAGASWRIAYFEPLEDPIEELGKAISQPGILFKNKVRPNFEAKVKEELQDTTSNDNGLIHLCEEAETLKDSNLLLIIDDFSSTFQDKITKPVKQKFFNLLLNAVSDPSIPVYILISLNKSDLLSGMVNEFPTLLKKIRGSQYTLHPLQESGLVQAIKGPAKKEGVAINDAFCEKVIEEIGSKPDRLIRLHRLMQKTWIKFMGENNETREKGIITKHFYLATGKTPQQLIKAKPKNRKAGKEEELVEVVEEEDVLDGIEGITDDLMNQIPLAEQAETIMGGLASQDRIAAKKMLRLLLFKRSPKHNFETRLVAREKLSIIMDYPAAKLDELIEKFDDVLELSSKGVQVPSTDMAEDWPRFQKIAKEETDNVVFYQKITDATKEHYFESKPIETTFSKADLEAVIAWDEKFRLAQQADWAALYNEKDYALSVGFLKKCREFLGLPAMAAPKKKRTITRTKPKPKPRSRATTATKKAAPTRKTSPSPKATSTPQAEKKEATPTPKPKAKPRTSTRKKIVIKKKP